MSDFGRLEGKPSELHPARVARDLGLKVRGGQLTWAQVEDAAVAAYWQNRVPITRRELATYRREQREAKAQQRREALALRQKQQNGTDPAVWLRRAGAA